MEHLFLILEEILSALHHWAFPDSSAGDPGSMLSGRSAREEIGYSLQYSWASLVAHLVKNPPGMWETWVRSLVGIIPWRKERLPSPVFWPGGFHGLYSPWVLKESDTNDRLSLHFTYLPLKKKKKTGVWQYVVERFVD